MGIITKSCEFCKKQYVAARDRDCLKYCSMQCYIAERRRISALKKFQSKAPKIDRRFWVNATDEQKLKRLEQHYNRHIIKKDGCWDWQGRNSAKYPQLSVGKGHFISIHRLSWMLHKGPIEDKLFVLHTCDNCRCSNPDHLYLGTQKENNRDRFDRNRANITFGERSGTAKIKNEIAQEIKMLLINGYSIQDICNKLDVAWNTVFCIKTNKTWRSIPWPTVL